VPASSDAAARHGPTDVFEQEGVVGQRGKVDGSNNSGLRTLAGRHERYKATCLLVDRCRQPQLASDADAGITPCPVTITSFSVLSLAQGPLLQAAGHSVRLGAGGQRRLGP
jgi:hypothetical protein